MTIENSISDDEAQIRHVIADWASAQCVKDIDRLMSHYAEDVMVFGVRPPYQTEGAAEWRCVWEEALVHFPASFQIEIRDLSVAVSGDLAFAHWHFHYMDMDRDHPAMQNWLRITVGYRKQHGRWRIVHEHYSVLSAA